MTDDDDALKQQLRELLEFQSATAEPRLSGPRLSGLFLWSQVGNEYLLVTIKIRSHVLFKTTVLKSAVKCEGLLLSKSKNCACACRS